MDTKVNVKHLSDAEASSAATRALFFGLRQAGLAVIDHLERYMRTKGWLRGPLTSEYRRRGREADRHKE